MTSDASGERPPRPGGEAIERLRLFLETEMAMSHIYQPVMIRTMLLALARDRDPVMGTLAATPLTNERLLSVEAAMAGKRQVPGEARSFSGVSIVELHEDGD